jgi:hypothetical protein
MTFVAGADVAAGTVKGLGAAVEEHPPMTSRAAVAAMTGAAYRWSPGTGLQRPHCDHWSLRGC